MAEETIIVRIELEKSAIKNATDNANRLAASISKLKTEIEASGKATIEQEAELKALTKEYKQNTEVLKQAETIKNSSLDSNNKLRAQLSILTKEYNGLSKSERETSDVGKSLKANIRSISDELKANESAVGDNRRNVGNYKEALGGLIGVVSKSGGGFGIAAQGVGGFNTALKANPILAIISVIIPLIQQLLKLKPVQDAIEQATNAVNAAFKITVGAIGDFVGAILSGKSIFSAFSDSFDNLGGRISEAAKQASILTKATQDLEDAQRAQIALNAQDEAAVKRLIIQSKDRTKSIEERLMLLFKATKIEQNNLEEQQRIAKEEARIAEQRFKLASKNASNLDELEKEMQEAKARSIQLESQSLDLQEKIENRRNALLQEREEAQQKATEKELQAQEKLSQQREKAEKEGDAFAEKEGKRFSEINKKRLEALNIARIAEQEAAEISFKALQDRIDREGEIKKNEATIEISDATIRAATIQEIDRMTLEAKLKNLQDYVDATGVATQEQVEQETALQAQLVELNRQSQEKKRLEDKKTLDLQIQSGTQYLGFANQLFGNLGALAEEGSQEAKDLAIAQGIINALASAIAAYQSAAAIPVAGFVLGPIAAAAALAAGFANVSKIRAVKAARGTYLKDGQGTETSDSIPAYLSKNETVINAKSSKRFLPLLSKINEWGGGVAFANRGGSYDYLVNRFAGGGIPTQISNSAFQQQEQSSQLANQINTIVPVLVLEEFQAVQGRQIRTATNLEL